MSMLNAHPSRRCGHKTPPPPPHSKDCHKHDDPCKKRKPKFCKPHHPHHPQSTRGKHCG